MTLIMHIEITLDGNELSGPIQKIPDSPIYRFTNTLNKHDIYVEVSKNSNGTWYQSGGPNIKFPDEFIKEIGSKIDEYIP